MGCSAGGSTKEGVDAAMERGVGNYPKNKADYEKHHNKAKDNLASTTFFTEVQSLASDLRRYADKNTIKGLVKEYVKKYDGKDTEKQRRKLATVMKEFVSETLIPRYMLIKSIDIFATAKYTFEKKFKDYPDQSGLINSFKPLTFVFEDDMKAIIYYLGKDLADLGYNRLNALNNVLAFNDEFTPNILIFKLNQKLFSDLDTARDLAMAIGNMEKLDLVGVIICPEDEGNFGAPVNEGNDEEEKDDKKKSQGILQEFGIDCTHYDVLGEIFRGIAKNRNIKGLIIDSIVDYNLMMAPEIANVILQKLQSETLKAFHLGGFSFGQAFLSKFTHQLASTRALKLLSLNGERFLKLLTEEDNLNNLAKNKSISLLAFQNIKEDDLNKNKLARKLSDVKSEINPVFIKDSIIDLHFHVEKKKSS